MVGQLQRWRFTVDDYYKMAEAGILCADDRVELLDGEIVRKSPIGSPHAAGVKRVTGTFYRAFGDRAIISVQDPVRLDGVSEPEPDVALLLPRADLYAGSHPGPEDVLLIVEVADTSLALDRRVKLPLYAGANIPEVWISIVGRTGGRRTGLEVHREPAPDGYRRIRRYRRGQSVSPLAFPDVEIVVEDLLGPEQPPDAEE